MGFYIWVHTMQPRLFISCCGRSYVDTTSLFAPGTLSQRATALCMKVRIQDVGGEVGEYPMEFT